MRHCPDLARKEDKQLSEILKDFSTPALVTAIEANSFEFWPLLARLPQAQLYDGPDMMRYVTGVPHPLFNGVTRARLVPEDLDAKIDETLTYFKSRRLPMMWWTGPSTRPADLGKHLQAHGLTHAGDSPGMAADLLALNEDLPAPSGLTMERVGDVTTLKKWLHPLTVGFEFPGFAAKALFDLFADLGFDLHLPWQNYVSWLKGEPVSCSSLFLAAGVAGIYNVATVPEARRKGIGAAMTLASLREARALGYRVAILHSSQMGLGVYERLGFEEYCTLSHYVWPAEMSQQ